MSSKLTIVRDFFLRNHNGFNIWWPNINESRCMYLRPTSISRSLERDERFIAGYADVCMYHVSDASLNECDIAVFDSPMYHLHPGLTTRLRGGLVEVCSIQLAVHLSTTTKKEQREREREREKDREKKRKEKRRFQTRIILEKRKRRIDKLGRYTPRGSLFEGMLPSGLHAAAVAILVWVTAACRDAVIDAAPGKR